MIKLKILVASLVAVSACQTIEGAGEDLETVGDGIEDATDNAS